MPRIFSGIQPSGEPAMSESLFVNGPKRLPIRFSMT
jgi:hypothetical protein